MVYIPNLNPNHVNTFKRLSEDAPEPEPVVEEPVEEVVEEVVVEEEFEGYTEDELFALNKSAQVELLAEYGLDKDEIKALKRESDRVEKILELQR